MIGPCHKILCKWQGLIKNGNTPVKKMIMRGMLGGNLFS